MSFADADDRRPTVLAVDDQEENLDLLDAILEDAGYNVLTAANGREALERVESERPQAILLDVMMPDMDGFEVCRRLKASRRTFFVPVVMVTALADRESKIRGLESGADDFLNKPINKAELLARLQALVRIRDLRDELDSTENVIFSMIAALEGKMPLTRDHSLRVAALSAATGQRLGLNPDDQANLVWGALLHDIGKIGVGEEVLWKRTRSPEEEELYRQHTLHGERILKPLESLAGALPIIRHHHERLDGSGYPDGLSGEALTPLIEIVAISDAYESYRRAAPDMPARWSLQLRAEARDGKLRAEHVEHFLAAAAELPAELPDYVDLLPAVAPPPSGCVYIADDNPANREIMTTYLEEAGYTVRPFADGQALLDAVATAKVDGENGPDVVLADVHMPFAKGEEVCEQLKADPRFAFLPVVLVTAQDGSFNKLRALEHGADDFLPLPVDRHELLARVRSLLRMHAFHEDLEEHEAVVLSLSGALEAKDPYTNGHSVRVGSLSVQIAQEMGHDDLAALMVTGGLLHDIGKVAVPQAILHKPARLTDEEMRIVKTHPTVGYQICRHLRSASPVLDCIRSHHERFDGSGYPDGLAGEGIPLAARILGMADAFDALTSARPYREDLSIEETFTILERETEQGKWDPKVFEALRRMAVEGRLAA